MPTCQGNIPPLASNPFAIKVLPRAIDVPHSNYKQNVVNVFPLLFLYEGDSQIVTHKSESGKVVAENQ